MDVVKTIFISDATQSFRTADAVEARYKKLEDSTSKSLISPGATANRAGFVELDKSLNKSLIHAANLRQTLGEVQKVSVGQAGFDGLGRAATRALDQVTATRNRLVDVQMRMARTSDPKVLDGLIRESKQAQAELDKLQVKINRVAAGRSAASSRQVSSGAASGLAGVGQLASAFLPNEIEAAVTAASAAGIGAGAIITFGGLAAAGAAVVKITQDIREEAERRLKVEESVAAAGNKQIITGQEILKNAQKTREEAERQRQFRRDIQDEDVTELRRRRALSERLLSLNPTGQFAERNQREILELDARIDSAQQDKIANADRTFAQNFENRKRAQEQFAESVKKATERVKELGEQYKTTFQGLQSQSTNPFVRIFTDADDAMKRLRESTRGLDKDLINTFENLQRRQNGLRLFEGRLNARLDSFDLRDQARRFRDTSREDTESADRQAFAAIERFNRDSASGIFRNPANLGQYFSGTSAGARVALFDEKRRIEESGGFFRNDKIQDLLRERLGREDQDTSIQGRLEKQLEIIRDLGARSEEEKSIADKRIIALTQGLNPGDLTSAQREQAAAAREREASRVQNFESDARRIAEETLTVNRQIEAHQRKLVAIAESRGTSGIEAILRIQDETGPGTEVDLSLARPTPGATQETYGGGFTL